MSTILNEYVEMIHFIQHFISKNTEIVLHDISKPEHSVIAIINGHISGRKIGSSLNGAALTYIRHKIYLKTNELLNYRGYSKEGHELVCYTRFIKDDNNKLLGMLCVNIDKAEEIELTKKLCSMFGFDESISDSVSIAPSVNPLKEHFPENVEETLDIIYDEVINESHIDSTDLSYKQRQNIMRKLEEKGAFLFKGAIPIIAKKLQISEATTYRYLAKMKGE